jgi:hypothetical protein
MAPFFTGIMRGIGGGGFGKRAGGVIPFSATGGNVSALAPGNGYKYHTFTSPGTFTVSGAPKNVEILVVAGGGGGATGGSGGNEGGAGGAGGLIYSPTIQISSGSYPIIIGSGGGAGGYGNPTTTGGLTSIAYGGGAGGGGPGGSGGGGTNGGGAGSGNFITGTDTPAGSPPQGNPAGSCGGSNGCGGGGAGSAGSGINAGSGIAFPQFVGPLIGFPSIPGTYAVGGQGMPGGGPEGGPGPGASNTGNGGGGTYNRDSYTSGGTGGSGIVIIRYLA